MAYHDKLWLSMLYHDISGHFVIEIKNIIFVAKMRNYDIFVAKIYDYTHIDSFWGSAGLIDSPTSSATMPTTNDCTVLLTEQKLWVIELQMNIKLFCINCTQFLKIMCKSPPDHFCCRSASAWGDKWCNDSFSCDASNISLKRFYYNESSWRNMWSV